MDWEDYRRFRKAFLRAVDTSLYPERHLDMLVHSGLGIFMCEDDAAIIFEVKVYPSGAKDVHGLVAAGNIETIVNRLIPRAEQWGRDHGCVGALIESRPGWARVLKNEGYETFQVSVRKAL